MTLYEIFGLWGKPILTYTCALDPIHFLIQEYCLVILLPPTSSIFCLFTSLFPLMYNFMLTFSFWKTNYFSPNFHPAVPPFFFFLHHRIPCPRCVGSLFLVSFLLFSCEPFSKKVFIYPCQRNFCYLGHQYQWKQRWFLSFEASKEKN